MTNIKEHARRTEGVTLPLVNEVPAFSQKGQGGTTSRDHGTRSPKLVG